MIPFGAILLSSLTLLGGQRARTSSELDPILQAGQRRLLEASTPETQRSALDSLRTNAGDRHERLVPQLFFFSETARSTREAMLFGVVLEQLAVPPDHVIDALVPLLESANAARRVALGNVLSQYEERTIDRGASFAVYRAHLEREPSNGLVRHLFDTDPDAALLILIRVQVPDPSEQRPLLWAWHSLADLRWKLLHGFLQRDGLPGAASSEALDSIAALAHHERWWGRLAALYLAQEEPRLEELVPLEVLSRDPHPLVRERALAATRERR